MRALVGLAVAAVVLVVGALPALALVLDDSVEPGHHRGYGDRREPGPWMVDGEDRDRGPVGRSMPHSTKRMMQRCLRAAPDLEGRNSVRPGAPDDSRPGDIPQWRDKSMRAFAHCLALLRGSSQAPGSSG